MNAKCPYCDSTHSVPMQKEQRYHCNTCFTSYSVTVGTVFHGTRVDLAKWFQVIDLTFNKPHEKISTRQLAKIIKVNKDTAFLMKQRIQKSNEADRRLIQEIAKVLKASFFLEDLEE